MLGNGQSEGGNTLARPNDFSLPERRLKVPSRNLRGRR
jgi:hypothetical protein